MLGRVASWALRRGLRRGVAEGSGPWLVVAVAAGVYKLATRPAKTTALRLKIQPGERYTILCSDEPIAR
jgi:hypothetical protein